MVSCVLQVRNLATSLSKVWGFLSDNIVILIGNICVVLTPDLFLQFCKLIMGFCTSHFLQCHGVDPLNSANRKIPMLSST